MNFVQEHLAGRVDLVQFYREEGVVFRGKRGLCPFHDDTNPSFDVVAETGVFICRSCGAGGDPVTFLEKRRGLTTTAAIAELRQRYGITTSGNGASGARDSAPERTWVIRDAEGNVVATHHRIDQTGAKKKLWWSRNGKNGLAGLLSASIPLYGSERVEGWDPGAPLFLVEGEKAADALLANDYKAVGTVCGAETTPSPAVLVVLARRDVVFWPDADNPGRNHMERMAPLLKPLVASLRWLSWSEIPKDDAHDFFARGGTQEQLDKMLADAPEWQPPTSERAESETASPSSDWLRPGKGLAVRPIPMAREQGETGTRVTVANLVKLSSVTRKKVEWLWYGRIARGKITDLFGDGDLGKSTILTDIAARVTRGRGLPDEPEGTLHDPRTVIVLTAEDGIEDTLKARFDEAGGDGDSLEVLESVTRPDGKRDLLSLSMDIPALVDACRRTNAALCTIDPFSAYLGKADAWKDQEVRRVLGSLKEGIEPVGTAVILLRHPPKGRTENPMHAGGGSVAISAACRTGLMVVKDSADADRRLLATYKHNLTKEMSTLAFRLRGSPSDPETAIVEWEVGTDPRDARQLLSEGGQTYEQRSAIGNARSFLKDFLAEGPQPAETVKAEATKIDISNATLRRAYDEIGAKPKKDGMTGPWLWRLK